MMHSSTGGGQRKIGASELKPFEGLVQSTVRLFAEPTRREEEDLAQELRIVVWKALGSFDASRGYPLEKWIFSAVRNKVRDFQRDAAREYARRGRYDLTFLHIEDMRLAPGHGPHRSPQEAFDARFHFIERDEVYRRVDEGKFVLPSNLTSHEARVLVMLMMELRKTEIAQRLGVKIGQVDSAVASLRRKFADWCPDERPDSSQTVSLEVAILPAAA